MAGILYFAYFLILNPLVGYLENKQLKLGIAFVAQFGRAFTL